jgi:hypothetical protein
MYGFLKYTYGKNFQNKILYYFKDMAGVSYEFIEYVDIEKRIYDDIKTYLIHHYDIYKVVNKPLIYPNNILIE